MTQEILIEDVGPIKELHIPIDEAGGVYVLRGLNGSGKTTALDAVQALASGSGRIQQRDGVARGEVSAFGATLRVARRLSRIGELEVESLEGRFSIADLVDPGIDNPSAADARRIKALIQLASKNKADASLFYDLVGGQVEFDKLIAAEQLETDDVVTMAARIKRALEEHARRREADAERDFRVATAARMAGAELDVTAPHDEQQLADAFSVADREDARLQAEATAAAEATIRREKAAKALDKTRNDYHGPTVEAAQQAVSEQLTTVERCKLNVEYIKEQLRTAERELLTAKGMHMKAEAELQSATMYEAAIDNLESIVFAPVPNSPTPEQLAAAKQRLKAAADAVVLGGQIRLHLEHVKRSETLKAAAVTAEKDALKLREAARATDDVLSKLVQKLGSPLRVSHGRLVTDTDRGEELFSDLSDGEKYTMALQIAIEAVGAGGLITLPQEAWQGLDPKNKQLVANQVAGTGVILLTAQATADSELIVEQFGASNG
jgi:hypothetical protein